MINVKTSAIVVHERALPHGKPEVTYEWIGAPEGEVRIGRRQAQRILGLHNYMDNMPDVITFGGITLRKVAEDDTPFFGMAAYQRDDTLWRINAARYWLSNTWHRLEEWAVLSLYIWNLAKVPTHHMPTWKHVTIHPKPSDYSGDYDWRIG